uniref:Uncharacterized protein n=1 Tax=viral metagenome TaxID=1070528 RepID=A0A6C0KGP7_9ZZZZ
MDNDNINTILLYCKECDQPVLFEGHPTSCLCGAFIMKPEFEGIDDWMQIIDDVVAGKLSDTFDLNNRLGNTWWYEPTQFYIKLCYYFAKRRYEDGIDNKKDEILSLMGLLECWYGQCEIDVNDNDDYAISIVNRANVTSVWKYV